MGKRKNATAVALPVPIQCRGRRGEPRRSSRTCRSGERWSVAAGTTAARRRWRSGEAGERDRGGERVDLGGAEAGERGASGRDGWRPRRRGGLIPSRRRRRRGGRAGTCPCCDPGRGNRGRRPGERLWAGSWPVGPGGPVSWAAWSSGGFSFPFVLFSLFLFIYFIFCFISF